MKLYALRSVPGDCAVAPCAGAWIETIFSRMLFLLCPVAPCAGAWIETMTT